MIEHFETKTHFQTYASERDASFSANCNVLLALLHQHDASRHAAQILKAARCLCNYWWDTHDTPRDKWVSPIAKIVEDLYTNIHHQNLSSLYSCMLLAQAFTDLLASVDRGLLQPDDDFLSRVSITLVQCCLRVMLKQSENGAWNDSVEQTSYGVAVLSEALRLSCFEDVHGQLRKAADSAVYFLLQTSGSPDYIWIEKVAYSSPFLTECYKLAALKSSMQPEGGYHNVGLPAKVNQNYVDLLIQMPLFDGVSEWQLQASSIESSLFSPMCRARRLEIFPRQDMEEDKYFDMIPLWWTACNNYSKSFTSTNYLYEMMVVSFVHYQVDEFMEAVAGKYFQLDIDGLRHLIDNMCLGIQPTTDVPAEVYDPLSRFVSRALQHPSVTCASAWDQQRLKQELRIYLQAHVTQSQDNVRLEQYDGSVADTFSHWVQTTSADHTSCPYTFAFVSCLLSSGYGVGSKKGSECFPTVSQKYFAESWCRHLSIMCRMYNDLGSVARDAAERNLNSVDFPEFATTNEQTAVSDYDDLIRKKDELFKLAQYERSCLDDADRRLKEEMLKGRLEINKAKLAVWRVYRDVTDLLGQIYVVRDIASRMKPVKNGSGK
jgi:hypothetical protein